MPISAYVQTVAFMVLACVALFASAGTLAFVTYWVYLAIFAAGFVATFLLVDPDLARERMRPAGKHPPPALWVFTGVLFAHWIVAGLDYGRFHWSDSVPSWLQWLGLAAVAASYAFCLWAMRINRFFSSVVRIQSDRGQVVISAGPYACIRHPGYIAGIVLTAASGLALNSWLATTLLVVCSLPFLLYRTVTEDRVLKTELPGYRDYAERVRWRLLPGIW
jgi:protein-S-isoprenylcysteine O-methyltransferase Ste14